MRVRDQRSVEGLFLSTIFDDDTHDLSPGSRKVIDPFDGREQRSLCETPPPLFLLLLSSRQYVLISLFSLDRSIASVFPLPATDAEKTSKWSLLFDVPLVATSVPHNTLSRRVLPFKMINFQR